MDLPGYDAVRPLLRSGAFAVYRGFRTIDRRPVLLKTTVRRPPRAGDLETIEREHRLLTSVGGAGVPAVLDLVRTPELAFLALDDQGLLPLRSVLSQGAMPLASFFRLALNLCRVLALLHDRGVIHGAINPAGIFTSATFDRVQLVDFAAAGHVASETMGPAVALTGEAAAYISPEQTGRINRRIDHRTDLYSLGATFYELLTGSPPFASADTLELIHAQIARIPRRPSEVEPLVPGPLSQIVLRLLAKEASDRYQTVSGLARDLERCERDWLSGRAIAPFELGLHDVSDRFLIPQKLYGRARELGDLTAAFERTCGGGTRLVLVAGPAGAGKTALIGELYRPIVRQRGKFVTGKSDPIVRDVPLGAFVRAFRSLVWQLLTESEDRLSASRERISAALGANAAVLAEVIPEIEFIIGRQPAPPSVDPAEAQNRFQLVFQNFVAAIADRDHPLVVFLDDLQWADSATLQLLHALLTSPDVRHALFVGACRDNEAGAGHPLHTAVSRLEAAGAAVERIALGPLPAEDVARFLADTLHADAEETRPLADLVLRRTDGTPFFVIQYLRTLHQNGLFVFDSVARRWRFALDAIAAADTTHDVVDLMTARIRRLSDAGQEVVTLAACLGSPFDVATVEAASGLAAHTVAAALSEAIGAGLVHRTLNHHELDDVRPSEATACAFVHDRVQQAAYGLIPEEDRKRRHLEIGRFLASRAEDPAPDDRLFAIVNHLNIGAEYVTDPETRRIVARTNLRAGRKAKQSTAFDTAATYLDAGISVLGAQDWQGDYDLLFALHLEAAECHYLGGRFETAERRFEELLEHAATPLDAAQVHSLRVVLCENLSRYDEAVASGRIGLALLGEHLPGDRTDIQRALDLELQAIERLLDGRPIARLSELPEVQDPAVRMVLRILTSLWAPAYLSGNQVLTRLVSARMVRLSLEHGNTEDSAYGYVTHAITVGPVLRDYETAYEWGVLALRVNERFGAVRRRAKIHQQFQAHVNLWRQPLETCIPHAREARRSGLDAGDFTYAGYGAVTESWAAFLTSASLDRFVRDHTPALALLDRIQMRDFFNALQIMLNWALALQGRTETPTSLSNEHFDEDRFAAAYEKTAPVFLGFLEAARTHLLVLHEAFVPALTSAARGRAVALEGTIWPVLLDFWGGLAITGAWADLTAHQRADYTMQLATARASLSELADNCPANFRCYALLLAAESARIDGRAADAASLCEDAIRFAGEIGSTQQHALACELAARARLAAGETFAASAHLGEAWRSYRSWGADAKLAQLERRYGALLERPASSAGADADRPTAPADDVETPAASLDMATVLKLARVIAGEIHLDRLVERLIRITLENAGAERGLFLLERDGQLVLEAEARADSTEVLLHGSVPLEAAQVPLTVVRYVRRTGQPLVVGDALADERFAQDPCLVAAGVSSVLCVPVSQQGRLRGLLYLENRLTSHAFTPERTEMVRILAAQAAISLENARLYEEMRAEVERRTAAEHRLREALAEVEALKNRLEAENVYLQEEIHTEHNFNEVVGNSPALLDALRRIELVAPTDSSVLILGETGSGKELFARAVHSRSARRARPLVKVNCGAIAPGLVESELFGHVKGAFTGAIDRRVGRFELAHGGTIFLDEVGELPLDAQVKLLRVLQEQEFEPVGSSRTVRVDVRVIAATNRDLDRAVADGRFRADLLYRLNVFPVAVPPLRERPGDIPLLAGFFVSGLARKLGKPLKGFSTRSMERLMQYSWPGNVRELQNVVERSAILAQSPVLEVESGFAADSARIPAAPVSRERSTLDEIQRAHILSVLKSTGGIVEGARGAATILGLHPNTLRSRMKKLGIPTGSGG
jgi:predicted ATPase/transcriptional regulator with GAF, ATPase, and Fis domain